MLSGEEVGLVKPVLPPAQTGATCYLKHLSRCYEVIHCSLATDGVHVCLRLLRSKVLFIARACQLCFPFSTYMQFQHLEADCT